MNLNPASLAAVVTFLLGAGGGLRWWIMRYDARTDPISRATAEAALAEQLVGTASEQMTRLSAEVTRVSEECKTLRARADASEKEARDQRTEMDKIRTAFSLSVSYIGVLLRGWPKASEPPPSIPEHLHSVLPPSEYGWWPGTPPTAD